MRDLHHELTNAYGQGLAYRVNLGWLGPLEEAGDAPTAILSHRPQSPLAGPQGADLT